VICLSQSVSEPPLFEHLLLENPWPLVIVLICGAAVLRVIARRHEKRAFNLAALVTLLLAGGIIALAHLVHTPRERVTAATHELLDATADNDPATIERLLDPRIVLADEGGNVRISVGELRPRLDRALEKFPLASQRAKDLAVEVRGKDVASAYLALRTGFTDNAYPPAHTQWRLEWRCGDDGVWRLVEVRWLRWMGRTPPWHGLP
jgi:hypothetical protein